MKLNRGLVVGGVFLAFGLHGHHAQARGPSTPEERAKVIELTRMLERDPLNENADATRQWLREWTIEVPEIRFHVCNELLSHGLGENYPYSREINLQTILSGAVFTLEHQDKARDNVGAHIAGVEGSLRMYEVLAKSRPDARSAFLDGLVAMRDRGELADHVAKLAAEKCPKSNILLIAAPIGAAVGLILGSLIGWLFGGRRGHRSSAPDVASAENRSAKFTSAAQWIVFACAAYYVIVGAALHFLEPEYDPRYRFMSEYAWSPPWLAHDYNILCACPGLAYRRPSLAKRLWTVAECTCGIRPSGSRSRWYMRRGSIPGIPASRCGRCGWPSERGHGSTASLMELSARAGLAAPLPHYSSYRTWNLHCTSLDGHRCGNAGAAAANFPQLSLIVARDRRAPVGSRNSSAPLTSPL